MPNASISAPARETPARFTAEPAMPQRDWSSRPGAIARLWPSEQMLRLLYRNLPSDKRAGRAIDIGCGNGRNAITLASIGFEPVLACDPSAELVASTRQRADAQGWPIDVDRASLPHLPYGTGVAELALAWGVLYVLERRATVLASLCEIHRVLRPAGVLLADWRTHMDSLRQFAAQRIDDVTVVMGDAAPLSLAGSPYSFWTRDDLESIYCEAGFEITDMQREEIYEVKTDQCYSWWQVCARPR
jgi:SAM-dependent methyltransferase